MNKLYKRTVITFLILGLLGIGYMIFDNKSVLPEEEADNFRGQADEPRDVFGTTIGTSTTPTTNLTDAGYPYSANSDFSDMALNEAGYGTTSQAMVLDGQTDTALFTFKALNASSTSYYSWDIFGTNDNNCNTTVTSTDDDTYIGTSTLYSVLTTDIEWYDIGSSGARVSGSVSNPIGSATSTSRLLTNLNWKCLKVDLRGASTTVAVQLREKTNN